MQVWSSLLGAVAATGLGNTLPELGAARLGRKQWIAYGLVAACLILAVTWLAGEVATRNATVGLEARADAAAALHAAVLRSELEKHRSLPFVLVEDPDVREALQDPDPARIAALDRKLEALAGKTRAAVIYVLDGRGVAIAASNWRRPTSFVGSDYSFRPYYRDALTAGSAEDFAMGAVSRVPGLFLSRRVLGPGGPLGVVVVKVEFGALETEWRGSSDPAFVTDGKGRVLITSVPEWRFRSIAPRDAGRRGPPPLPFARARSGSMQVSDRADGDFVAASVPAAGPDWTLHLLTPSMPAVTTAATAARSVTLLVGALLAVVAGLLLLRGARAAARTTAQRRIRAELEARVAERTQALQEANERLILEMEERRRAEASRQIMQDELVQANKLATLGQIAAGVAHEINQPVSAIRTYADNAIVLMDRSNLDSARSNLGIIASLTERIGAITGELRAFSRKTSGRPEPIPVEDAIAGALLLVGPRARQQGVAIRQEGDATGLRAMAERVRLEQVLVNLLQNALEALVGRPSGLVTLGVEDAGQLVRISVADDGPGLDAEAEAGLFTPFVTTKAKGLGLGLVISHDLIADFGGELTFEKSPTGGAMFTVSLRKAA